MITSKLQKFPIGKFVNKSLAVLQSDLRKIGIIGTDMESLAGRSFILSSEIERCQSFQQCKVFLDLSVSIHIKRLLACAI